MVAKVTITVDKDGNVFKANTVLPNDTEFNNSVKQTEATSAQFAFTKALAGRKLKDGEFTFVLKDEKGNVLQTVKIQLMVKYLSQLLTTTKKALTLIQWKKFRLHL